MSLGLRIGRLSRWAGLIVIVLLVTAAAAQAKGEWKIAEQTMTGLEASEASIFGTASETFKLSVAWYASEIECSTLATEAPTKIFPGGTSEAILKLSSCQVLGPPFVSETCKVLEPTELKVVGELLLHGSKTYELFKAATGESLGTIKFKEGTECPLSLNNELKGTFVGETEAGERKEQPLTLNSTVEALFGSDSLSFGTHPATLKGKSTWALAAGYKGLKWAAVGEESTEEEEEKLEEEKLEKEELQKEEEKELEEKELIPNGWTLKKNGTSVKFLNLDAILLGGELLFPGIGLTINCTGGVAEALVATASEGEKLTGSIQAVSTGCKTLNFEKTCTVHSSGLPDGQISFEGEGEAEQSGVDTLLLMESAEFTVVEILGALCQFEGWTTEISGSALLTLLDPATSLKDHLAHLDEEELFLGEEETLIDGPGGSAAALAHVTELSGSTWAIGFK